MTVQVLLNRSYICLVTNFLFCCHLFSPVEVDVSINIYILQSDVLIYRSLCTNKHLLFLSDVFFHRSLCTNKHLYFIVKCFLLYKSMYQYTSIFYSLCFQLQNSIQQHRSIFYNHYFHLQKSMCRYTSIFYSHILVFSCKYENLHSRTTNYDNTNPR